MIAYTLKNLNLNNYCPLLDFTYKFLWALNLLILNSKPFKVMHFNSKHPAVNHMRFFFQNKSTLFPRIIVNALTSCLNRIFQGFNRGRKLWVSRRIVPSFNGISIFTFHICAYWNYLENKSYFVLYVWAVLINIFSTLSHPF